MKQLHEYTAIELRAMLAENKITAAALTQYYLGRIEIYDKPRDLNAVACLLPDALEQARRLDALPDKEKTKLPLFGLPVLIKDNIDIAGLPTTAGSLAFTDNIAKKDAPIVTRLREKGAVILGKTNLTELANFTTKNMPNGYSSFGGQVHNAYDPDMDPSGSSTGSGVAMSAGFCAGAVGTDTCFSIVYCALKNGITGIKPAHGNLPTEGIVPISHSLDSPGPMTRTMEDALLFYDAMRETPLPEIAPVSPEQLSIAVNVFQPDFLKEEENLALQGLLKRLQAAGAQIGEVIQPAVPAIYDMMICEFRHDLEAYLKASSASRKTMQEIVDFYEADPERMMKYGIFYLKAALEASENLDDESYLNALKLQKKLRGQVEKELEPYDACMMTGPSDIMHFLALPSVTLRLGMTERNTPMGLILYGTDEVRLLSAALTIERYCCPMALPPLP